jgi:hypothetical protein
MMIEIPAYGLIEAALEIDSASIAEFGGEFRCVGRIAVIMARPVRYVADERAAARRRCCPRDACCHRCRLARPIRQSEALRRLCDGINIRLCGARETAKLLSESKSSKFHRNQKSTSPRCCFFDPKRGADRNRT